MRRHGGWLFFWACATAAVVLYGVPRGHASQYFDGQRGEVSGRLSTQNTFQHNNADSFNWVQWRNEVRFDIKYDLIEEGSGTTWGPLKTLKFNMLYRGRFDAAYELRDSYKRRDYDRGDFEFPEGKTPRELFFDIGFVGALQDLSLRIGKQQVVWGESDLFRSIDVVNPLDLRQNGFVGEDFADFRQPLWIAKALYHLGDFGAFLNGASLEMFFSPNSRPQATQHNLIIGETFKIHTNQSVVGGPFNRHMSLPFNQVRHPWEILRVGARMGDSPAVVQNPDGSLSDFMYRIKNDVRPTELSTSAMMAGVRLLGTTYGNAFFTLNYLFKRSDTASASALLSQIFDPTMPGTGTLQADVLGRAVTQALTPDGNGNGIPDGQEEQILNCLQSKSPAGGPPGRGELILDPRAVNPAFTGPWHGSVYSDPAHPELDTGVARPGLNQLATDHVPYQPVLPVPGDGLVHSSACLDIPVFHPWTHIIGFTATYNDFDYTGLVFRLEQSYSTKEARQLSNASPERLQRQLENPGNPAFTSAPTERDFETRLKRFTPVWRSMVGFDYLRSIAPGPGHSLRNPLLRSLLTDQWFFTFQFLNEYNSHADHVTHAASFTDRFQHFNPFFTVSGTGFFLNQTFRPTWAVAFDTNQLVPLTFLQAAYFLTPRLEMRLGSVIYAGSVRSQDNNFLYDYADRDTFYVRLTYFLA
ncbi:MAG: DUF1302 family protein [Candidatus Binatia bacterium]